MKKNRMRNIPIIFFALIGGAVFVYIGYMSSAIIQPFEVKNYNQFTPIMMVLAFVIYEFIIFLLFVYAHKKEAREKIVVDSSDIEGDINVYELEEKVIEQVQQEPQQQEKEISIDGEIFRELYSYDFSLEQITEMIRLSSYLQDVDTDTYVKMFDISMTPEQISQYIDLFYGE